MNRARRRTHGVARAEVGRVGGRRLLGFAAALRRSEHVALDLQDLEFDLARGVIVTIRRSKTDQEKAGQVVAVPYARARDRCAIRALQEWLQTAGIQSGPVFRQMRRGDRLTNRRLSDQSVALIVKRRATSAGLPHTELLSGHPLRAGYATAAAAAGVEERKIANLHLGGGSSSGPRRDG